MTGHCDVARRAADASGTAEQADAAGLSTLLSHLYGQVGQRALTVGLGAMADWAGASFGAARRSPGGPLHQWPLGEDGLGLEQLQPLEQALAQPVGEGEPAVSTVPLPGGSWALVVPLAASARHVGRVLLGFPHRPPLDAVRDNTLEIMGQIVGYGLTAVDPPEDAADAVDEAVVGVSKAAEPPLGKHILVVEDDREIADSLCAVLSDEGYEVAAVHRGEAALSQVRSTRPDLLILDVRLPGIDGFGVAAELARDRSDEPVPVLFLSASSDLPSRVRGLHSGTTDYLRKPFSERDLLTRVEQAILRSESSRSLRESARLDALTGLGNSRLFEERLKLEGARMERYQTALTIAVFDLDKLKAINDRHGHTAGSEALRAVGQALKQAIRGTDLAARYGGDEFVVLLPHTDLPSGVAFAQRVLEKIRYLEPAGIPVSVSGGVACFDGGLDASVEDLFSRADAASYRAKRAGGNQVSVDWGRTAPCGGASSELSRAEAPVSTHPADSQPPQPERVPNDPGPSDAQR